MASLPSPGAPRESTGGWALTRCDWPGIAILVLLFAHSPLLLEYFRGLWAQPHYRFYPFALAATLWFSTTRGKWSGFRWTGWIASAALIDAALLTMGAALHSPWLAALGAFLLSATMLAACPEKGRTRSLGYLALLLLLLVRPPLRLDLVLAERLQSLTTQAASNWLHHLGCLHFRAGNVLEFPTKTFLVEEACGGVHSAFTIVFLAAFLGVQQRRNRMHIALLLLTAVGLAAIANVCRVMLIAGAWDVHRWDWSEGWRHQLLGNVIIMIVVLLMCSADQLIRLLTGPVPNVLYDTHLHLNPLIVAWNWAFREPPEGPESLDPVVRDEIALRRQMLDLKRTLRNGRFAVANLAASLLYPARGIMGARCGWLIVVLAILLAAPLMLIQLKGAPPAVRTTPNIFCRETFLPHELHGLQLIDFEQGPGNVDGSLRRGSWRYDWQGQVVSAVCDFPFTGWHSLIECYTRQGWSLEYRRATPIVYEADKPSWACVEACLRKPTGEFGYLLFSLFDVAGQPVAPPDGVSPGASLWDRLMKSPWNGSDFAASQTVQVQLFLETPAPLSNEQQRELVEQHRRIRDRLRVRFAEAHDGE